MRFSVFPALALLAFSAQAWAQAAPGAPPSTPRSDRALVEHTSASEPAGAHEHFERALTWYRAGKYRRAVEELDAALDQDPGGKDLIFNLALVQEKLGDFDGAIRSLGRFQSLEKDPDEIERATQAIERLQGARSELSANSRLVAAPAVTSSGATARERGKLDGWVIGTGSFALASFVVGTVFVVRALSLDSDGDSSGARDSAMIGDLALAGSVLSGAGSLGLYLGRYKDASPGAERGGSASAALSPSLPRISTAGIVLRY